MAEDPTFGIFVPDRITTFSNPTIIPNRYQNGLYKMWLQQVSHLTVPSAREYRPEYNTQPYEVVYSLNRQSYVVYYNNNFSDAKERFYTDMEEGVELLNNRLKKSSSPRRKRSLNNSSLQKMCKNCLQHMCKHQNIKGYSKLNKQELVKLLSKARKH